MNVSQGAAFRRAIKHFSMLATGWLAFAAPARAAATGWPVGNFSVMLALSVALAALWCCKRRLKAEARARQQAVDAMRQSEARLIEAQRVAQDALSGKEEKFRLAFEHANAAMFLIAPDGHILQTNDRASQILGYSRSELESMTVSDITLPEDSALSPVYMESLISGDFEHAVMEKRYRHKQGRVVHGLLSSALLRDAQRQPLYFVAQVQDISERKQLEQELRASEEKFRRFVEGASDVTYTLDLDGRFQYISPNWAEMLGSQPDEFLGQSHSWLIHPDDLPSFQAFLDRVLSSRSKQCGIEYRVRHADGEWRWHTSNAAPLLDAANRLVGVLGIARDISERKQADARVFHMAHFDALTDLPNRSLFNDRLQQALYQAERHGNRIALLYIDLDHFKLVNDRWGHAVGDLVLQEVASRITGCVRVSDTVGRLGGDEFVILLVDAGCEREVVAMAERIRRSLEEPFLVRGQMHALSCCVGIAVYPQHGLDEVELTRHADLAMYLAKASGRDNVKVFSPGLAATRDSPAVSARATASLH